MDTVSMQRGFSIVEILIASAIALIVISGAAASSGGFGSTLMHGQTNAEALAKAQQILEQTQALGQEDFNLVNPIATTLLDGPYFKSVDVQLRSDFLTKLVTATILWRSDSSATSSTQISTLVTNLENVNAPDTCDSELSGDWSAPHFTTVALTNFPGVPAGIYTIGDLDAYKGMLYVAIATTSAKTNPTLLVFDISNPTDPKLKGMLDNNASAYSGLAAIRVAEDHMANKRYVFGANIASAQLQVFNVTNASVPQLVTSKVVAPAGVGNSIFYHDGYVYLGLTSNAGNELYVVDVHVPTMPDPKGGYDTGSHDVNAIFVRHGYAYIAHRTFSIDAFPEQLTVLDVHTPYPYRVSGWRAPHTSGNGKSLAQVGDTLYLGRTITATDPEFTVLNDIEPVNLAGNNAAPSVLEIGDSVNAFVIRDYLAFLVTNSRVRIFRIDDKAHIIEIASTTLPVSGSSFEPSLDCEGNTLYIGSNDAGGNGYLSIVTAGP